MSAKKADSKKDAAEAPAAEAPAAAPAAEEPADKPEYATANKLINELNRVHIRIPRY